MRVELEASGWRRGCSGWVGVTPASNPDREEGESGASRLAQAPVRDGEHLEPKHRHMTGLNRPDSKRVWQTDEAELWRAQIHYGEVELGQIEHGERLLTSG
jgi:hypothetical protein